jgi:flap endonuclease-1
MGIRHLNKFIRTYCPEAIRQMQLYELRNKKIVIDTSIYMYRYASSNNLIENMYQLIALFKHNNIIPLFVFDGKPPTEKKELLKLRSEEKKSAEEKYKQLQLKIKECKNNEELIEINSEMDSLRKQFVRLSNEDIDKVKKLMDLYGVCYIQAEGEADKLCAKMVAKNEVYACLSEDMDLFVYGCPRVLRYISLLNCNVVLYSLKDILYILDLSLEEFKKICILSGTDYNIKNKVVNDIYQSIKVFQKYRKTRKQPSQCLFEWMTSEELINNDDYNLLLKIYEMFDLNKMQYDSIQVVNKKYNKELLQDFLNNYDFVFV